MFLGVKSKSKVKVLKLTPLNNSSRFGFKTFPSALESSAVGFTLPFATLFTNAALNAFFTKSCPPP